MKAVFFDFDGTLTHRRANVWKSIWQMFDYDISEGSYYRQLFNDFLANRITHQQWCDLTCEAFKNKGMTIDVLNQIASKVELLAGVKLSNKMDLIFLLSVETLLMLLKKCLVKMLNIFLQSGQTICFLTTKTS